MSEHIDTNWFEKIPAPSEREVMKLITSLIGRRNYSEVLREEGSQGIHRLVIEIVGDDGDLVRYDYQELALDIFYFNSEGIAVGGSKVASFERGEWVLE